MPWTGPEFAERHNHALHGADASHAARMANAILNRGASERIAIATANKYFEKHDDGGYVGGLQPSNQTANPLTQGMIQRYSSMTPEKLQELAAMMGGTPQGQIVQRVLAQKRAMPANPADQQQTPGVPQQTSPIAQPSAFNPAATQPGYRRGGWTQRRDVGGGLSLGQADPYWSRNDMRQETSGAGTTGYLHGTTSGRADKILTNAPAGAYVVPADVVSGLGEGNSLAGAGVIQKMLDTGPHGIPMPRGRGKDTAPHPPPAYREPAAKGGTVHGERELTPVALSHGEFVVPPEHVHHWGGGDIKVGHKWWDDWVVKERKKIIDKMRKLPGPVKAAA